MASGQSCGALPVDVDDGGQQRCQEEVEQLGLETVKDSWPCYIVIS